MDPRVSLSTTTPNDIVVRMPRHTDAIGSALRGAFRTGLELPVDLLGALERLDAPPKAV